MKPKQVQTLEGFKLNSKRSGDKAHLWKEEKIWHLILMAQHQQIIKKIKMRKLKFQR